ncbi:adenosylcobinamide-phosphate synthase CbiB [Alkaliphilus hydrothermalis]|uniref:Cobalamin biosynthesis protein CobD n=1 Tax=Alkaliphilus hydrothermalis TaxID=1482730 RepID=A0ABS2NN77_9FIRM|nr:adenosylcobinamide-phosphate synthase CbiB [Alkaliphilus hydrothermalis]MBM7614408.1 adenosylcobinamide-phosphate synthase [Alkaliphilus hydrothermalis]
MMVLVGGYILDLILGDPQGFPHPVRFIGGLINRLEKLLYTDDQPKKLLLKGGLLTLLVVSITCFITFSIIRLATLLHPGAGMIISIILAYTILATKSLHKESEKVLIPLRNNDLPEARKYLSYIVSRDTSHLQEEEIIRGTVETVAENISDGIIAPLFYLFLGGAPLAMAYKAINTLDSMVGYKNDKYLYFGRASARLDDIANYIPARLTAVFIVLSSYLLGKMGSHSLKIALRDGRNHNSPNSGYPEAAVAGALGIQLGGDNQYFGKILHKPIIGDAIQSLQQKHLTETYQLMYMSSAVGVITFLLLGQTLEVL